MHRMVPEPQSLATYQLGTARPLNAIQQRFSVTFNIELSTYQVDQAVRNRRLQVGAIDAPLPQGWDKPLLENARTIVTKLVEAWGSGLQFDAMVIGGGGAEIPAIAEAIQGHFKQAQVVPGGQLAVALGYARLARLLAQQAARS